MNKENKENEVPIKPKIVQKLEPFDIAKIEIAKNLFLRIIINENNEKKIDIRKFYKGFPTKQGVQFDFDLFNIIKKTIEEYEI